MNFHILARNVFATMLICAGLSTGVWAADSKEDLTAAVKEVEQAEAALAKAKDPAEIANFWADDVIDIHPSGWRYAKAESLQIGPNLKKLGGTSKTIKSGVIDRKVVPINKDTIAIETDSESYYEVPNPQEAARAAGTMTFDPAAIAKAAAASGGRAPGVGSSPSLYRNRSTTVWARMNGRWQIVVRQSTDIGERVAPGRF